MSRDTVADPTPTGPMTLVEISQATGRLIDTGKPRGQRLRGMHRRHAARGRPS
jgi:hypothetical protein